MPNNGINAPGQVSGSTYYLTVQNQAGQYLVPGTPIFENYNSSHWATYINGAATANSAGDWFGVFPTNAATVAGIYSWQVRLRVGGTAAITDPTVFQDNQSNWDGTGFVIPASGGGSSSGYSGVAQGTGGGPNTIQLASGASSIQNYVGQQVVIFGTVAGIESNVVVSYNSTTKTATCMNNWKNAITNATPYAFPGILAPAIEFNIQENIIS